MVVPKLPPNYTVRRSLNLRKGKLYAPLSALLNVILFLAAILVLHRFVPFITLFDRENGAFVLTVPRLLLNCMWILVGLLLYAILYLALKGAVLGFFGDARPKFGIKGFYTYVSSSAYFSRKFYVLIYLLPDLIMAALLLGLAFVLPKSLFWLAATIGAFHISRLGTSLLLTILVLCQPKSAFFRNNGTLTVVYTPQEGTEGERQKPAR